MKRTKEQEIALIDINKHLKEIRDLINANWNEDRILIKISDVNNPPRVRREDIEGNVSELQGE
jgi:hypothetical protein